MPKDAASLLVRERDGQWQVTKSWAAPRDGARK
jgi:hypothetical protein